MKRFIILMFLLLCVPVFAQRKLTTNEATILAVGPFFDSTDGITPETAITVTGLTVEIYRELDDGSICTRFANFNPTASGGNNDMALVTSSVSGMYSLEITAAQVNFTGSMILTIVDTDSAGIVGLPLWRPFLLTSANVVDAEYGTDKLQVDQVELGSSTQSATDLKDFADAGYNPATDKVTGVLLTDTTTASTDAETAIGNLNDFDPANDDVAVVTSVTTTTTNSDMITAATVEGECIDALESFKLDELNAEAVTTSLATAVNDNSILGYILASANVSNYVRTEDSLEDLRERGDAAWDTATGFAVASDVTTAHSTTDALVNGIDDNAWDDGTRTLTAFDEDSTTIDIDGTTIGTVSTVSALGANVVSAASVSDAAWQEMIELLFTYDATATYGDESGSVVDQIADNVSGSAASVWAYGTRILTALDEDSTTIDLDGSAVGSVTAAVTTDAASRTASKADVNALATSAALTTHDGKLDTVDDFLDTEIADIIDKLSAIMSKAYSIVTAVGTYDPATDALEAQQENPQGPPIID